MRLHCNGDLHVPVKMFNRISKFCNRKLLLWGGLFLLLYILFTCFAAYTLFRDKQKETSLKSVLENIDVIESSNSVKPIYNVEIWGKAAIGAYLWEHILEGKLQSEDGNTWFHGELQIDNIQFTYRSGPAITKDTVPPHTTHLIIALNGRSEEKIQYARSWLDSLNKFQSLRKVGVVILGDERCNNDWIVPYLHSNGGPINVLFLIYDSHLINNDDVLQWPLGVAIYRRFPQVLLQDVSITSSRQWSCNFLGTVYPGSSRETLMGILQEHNFRNICYTAIRNEWVPNETEESLKRYLNALGNSDLTLSPVGKNTECYRFLEALSYGSIPVVENILTNGNCSSEGPLRLLKAHKAPFIYIKDWNELKGVLEREKLLTNEEKVQRRLSALMWYQSFKLKMKHYFISAVQRKILD